MAKRYKTTVLWLNQSHDAKGNHAILHSSAGI